MRKEDKDDLDQKAVECLQNSLGQAVLIANDLAKAVEENRRLREQVVRRLLAHYVGSDSAALALVFLKDPDDALRRSVLRAWCDRPELIQQHVEQLRGTAEAVDYLRRLLHDAVPPIGNDVTAAISWLEALGPAAVSALPELERIARLSQAEDYRQAAEKAIATITAIRATP